MSSWSSALMAGDTPPWGSKKREPDSFGEYDDDAEMNNLPATITKKVRRLSNMHKRRFGEVEGQAGDLDVRKSLASSPPAKRSRHKLDVSEDYGPTKSPVAPMSFEAFSRKLAVSVRQGQVGQPPVNPGRQTSLVAKLPPQRFTAAQPLDVQRFSEWLEQTSSPFGRNAVLSSNPSSLTNSSTHSLNTPISTPVDMQYSSFEEFSNQSHGHGLQTIKKDMPSFPHQQGDQHSSSTKAVTTQQPEQPQLPTQPAKHHACELKGFPSRKEELPAGLSLGQVARDYPNHLIGHHLRPFIAAGWSAKKIWDALRDSAKVSGAKRRYWNKYEYRLINEKKRMAEEEEAQEAQDTQNASHSEGSMPANINGSAAFNDAVNEVQGLPTSSPRSEAARDRSRIRDATAAFLAQSSVSRDASKVDGSIRIQDRLNTIKQLFNLELRKQQNILSSLMSYDDPQWLCHSQSERNRHIAEEWIRRARRLERAFAIGHDIDADDLEIEPTSVRGMLERFNVLLRRSASSSLPVAAHPTDDESRLAACEEQLEMVQEWTIRWSEQLQERIGQNAGGAAPQLPSFSSRTTYHSPTSVSEEKDTGSKLVDAGVSKLYTTGHWPSQSSQYPPRFQNVAAAQGYASTQDYRPGPPSNYHGRHPTTEETENLHSYIDMSPHAAYRSSHPRGSNVLASHGLQPSIASQNLAVQKTKAHTTQAKASRQFDLEDYLHCDKFSDAKW